MSIFWVVLNDIFSCLEKNSLEIIAILIVWVTFKFSIWYARKSILLVLEEELKLIGEWLGNKYDKDYVNKEWYHPGRMVVALRRQSGLQAFFSSPYVNLFSRSLIRALTSLNQGTGRFNQLVDRYLGFVGSSLVKLYEAFQYIKEDLKNKRTSQTDIERKIKQWKESGDQKHAEHARYLELLYILNKDIHIQGIGTVGYYDSKNEFPYPHQSYLNAKREFEKEKKTRYWSLSRGNWRGLLSDGLILTALIFNCINFLLVILLVIILIVYFYLTRER